MDRLSAVVGRSRPGAAVVSSRAIESPATDAAAALLAALVASGVRHFVVSPGSRSQALALAAAELERRGAVRLHVRIDERVAGFTALGIGRETGAPAAVVCTSGTAAANLLPAVLEAHHAGVSMLLLTADRPSELRGVGANQTTRQPGMFAPNVRFEVDLAAPEAIDADGGGVQSAMLRAVAAEAVAAALGAGARSAGPAHLNLPYREPLGGDLPPWLGVCGVREAGLAAEAVEPEPRPHPLPRGPRTIVLAGADAGTDAEALARAGGWPLVAEVVSGARFGRNLMHGYRALVADPALGGRIERVVVFGHPTLARETAALVSRPDVEVLAVRGPGEPLNLNGATVAVDAVRVEPGEADRRWLGAWMRASRAASADLSAAAGGSPSAAPIDRAALVDAVWRATRPRDRLVFGSSTLVRVADAVLVGKKIPVHANRGLAGIDGTIATATGVALASQTGGRPGVTRLLLGDLAVLHDVGALLLPPGEHEPRLQAIVGNDGGGTIFDALEVAKIAGPDAMDRVLYAPHSVRLEHLALAYGWEHERVATRAALDLALASPAGRRRLIEVPLER